MPEEPTGLERLFAQLDSWRDLPAYKLEPRVDAILALYLREVMQACLALELHEAVIPELPLRRGTLWGEGTRGANRSKKVDFVLFGRQLDTAYLVEVKTDPRSRSDEQDDYLQQARSVGWRAIIGGIITIARATSQDSVQKYLHLLARLSRLGFVGIPDEVWGLAFPTPARGLSGAMAGLENTARELALEVVYVEPREDPAARSIGFEAFARCIEDRDDGLAPVLARHLRSWQSAAGTGRPRSIGGGR